MAAPAVPAPARLRVSPAGKRGRHRRDTPPARVTLVAGRREQVLPADSPLARAIVAVAALLAHR